QPGIYSDTLNTSGCDSVSVLNLTMLPLIRDTIIRSVCAGQSYTFGGDIYSQPGIYSDTLNTPGCDSISVLNLTTLPLIRDTIIRSVCAGQPYTFGGNTYTQSGVYSDTLTTSGCDSIVVLNLTVSQQLRDTITGIICAGESFSFNGNAYMQEGFYSDTLQSGGCDSIMTLTLTVIPAQQVDITVSALTINSGDMIQLNVTQSASYLWTSSGATLNNFLIQNPTAVIQNSTWIYINTTSNPGGCKAEDSVFISISTDSTPCTGSYIHMPGAFTPNNDGLNDKVGILYDKVSLVRFLIYNRWGESVFETTDINKSWDGRYKGAFIPGAYIYLISYYVSCDGRKRMLKGSVLLIR
ncbi:MAG: gliding motility-associated C-terminal domain-containing protein, partial [Ferruginibacter sp.]|nr:gliding motility-associated C-terminal domain-containing protein [Ferruginibacter sp.]